jgi:hypothetical protein
MINVGTKNSFILFCGKVVRERALHYRDREFSNSSIAVSDMHAYHLSRKKSVRNHRKTIKICRFN